MSDADEKRVKINLETARINWHELQTFFAKGQVIFVDDSLDLVQAAYEVSEDNGQQIKTWMDAGLLGQVSDEQAGRWFEQKRDLWAVVVRPWVLVQEGNQSE